MRRITYRVLIFILLALISAIFYLSTIGIKTNKLNNQISTQIKNIHETLEIKLNKVNIILDPLNLRFNIKTREAILKNDDKILELESIKSNVSIKSLIDNQFYLTDLYISTESIEIKNLISFIRLLNDSPQLFITEKFINKGNIFADINLEFDEKGNIKDNYIIKGFVNDGELRSTKKFNFSKIDFIFELKKNVYLFKDAKLLFNKNSLSFPRLKATKKKNKFLITGTNIIKQISLNETEIKDLLDFTPLKLSLKNIEFNSENIFSFSIDNKFKSKDLKITTKLNLIKLNLPNSLELKEFFPNVKENIDLTNHQMEIEYDKNFLNVKGKGNISIQNELDKINYQFTKFKKEIKFNTLIEISENPFVFELLNYQKSNNSDLRINIVGNKNLNSNDIIFKDISLTENNNKLLVKELFLNREYKIKSVDNIEINLIDRDDLKNSISIEKKNKNYLLKGEKFNATKVINDLLEAKNKSTNENIFKNDFKIDIKIDKTFLDKNNVIDNLNGYLVYNDNKIKEAILESTFSIDKKLVFTIKSTPNEKITTLFTDDAKPFVNRYEFIKGFEEGNLDFYSIKKNDISKSTLIIDNFKVQEVPVLAKLLTLASLQGIADLLTGEGIRFTDFEMKFSNDNRFMKIEELYAIGPAISIMMDGYIENAQLISLRGTLVPATTINRTISSIPLIGKILVGKKTGEGVFGVSFKIKGPPKDLKTTVNPVKTLTPRFITRTLEKIKKN